MTAELATTKPLTKVQTSRVEALKAARSCLTRTGLASSQLPDTTTVTDLVDLAEWILSGRDPMEGWKHPRALEGDKLNTTP